MDLVQLSHLLPGVAAARRRPDAEVSDLDADVPQRRRQVVQDVDGVVSDL